VVYFSSILNGVLLDYYLHCCRINNFAFTTSKSGCFATFGIGFRYWKTGNELVTETLLKGAFSCFFKFGKTKQIDNLLIDYQFNRAKFY